MELTELKRVQNTKELPGYSLGAEAGDAGGSDKPNFFLKIGLAFTKEGAIGKAFSEGGFLGKDGFMDKNGSAIATGATGVIDMVNGIGAASKYNKTANDLLQDAGKSLSNIGGVGYTVQNDINKSTEEAQVDAEAKSSTLGLAAKGAATGAAIASVIPGVGTAVGGIVGGVAGLVGGLFGGASKKREMKKQMRLAEIKRINTNDFNRSGALTTVLQNNLAETEGDQTQQTLYAAANGKESYSAGGPTSGYNARVSNGEIIANKFTGEMFRVPGIPNNKDGKLAFIRPSDTIISNKYGLSDYVALTGDLEGGEAMQGTIMKALGKRGYKNGKLPGFVDGTSIEDNPYYKDRKALEEYFDYMLNDTSRLFRNGYKNGKLPGFKWGLPEWVNFAGNAYGYLTADSEKRKIDAEAISKPDTYQANPNAAKGLYILGLQQENPYAIIPELYNEYAKGMYAISNAGGLSGGQRALARLSALNNLTAQSAKLQQAAQAANIAHRQTYADAMLRYGAADAQNRMAAMQHDYNAYNQAHGAKRAMSSELLGKKVGYGLNFAKGVSDLSMWRDTKNMWDAEFKAEHPESADSESTSTATTASVPTTASTDYLNGAYGSYSNPYIYKAPDWFKGYTPGQDYSYKMNFGDVSTLTAPTGYKPTPTAATTPVVSTPQISSENLYGSNTAYLKMLATRNADALSHPTYSDNGGFSSYAAEKMGNYPTTKENNTTVKTKSAAKVDKKTLKNTTKKMPDSFKMPSTRGAAYYKKTYGDNARQKWWELTQWASNLTNSKSK